MTKSASARATHGPGSRAISDSSVPLHSVNTSVLPHLDKYHPHRISLPFQRELHGGRGCTLHTSRRSQSHELEKCAPQSGKADRLLLFLRSEKDEMPGLINLRSNVELSVSSSVNFPNRRATANKLLILFPVTRGVRMKNAFSVRKLILNSALASRSNWSNPISPSSRTKVRETPCSYREMFPSLSRFRVLIQLMPDNPISCPQVFHAQHRTHPTNPERSNRSYSV